MVSESLSREALVGLLADRILALDVGHPVRVAIDGRSAAGKSALANELVDRLGASGRQILSSSIDDFHPPGYKNRAAGAGFASPEEYLRDGYDFEAFRRSVLDPLGPGGERRCRLAHWKAYQDEPYEEEWVVAQETAVLVAEAAFAFLPSLHGSWEMTIWLHIDTATLLERVSVRDRWIGHPDQIVTRYRQQWLPRHRYYEEHYRPDERADVVVDNNDWSRPVLVRRPSSTV